MYTKDYVPGNDGQAYNACAQGKRIKMSLAVVLKQLVSPKD